MKYKIIEKNLGPMLLLDDMESTDPDYGELMSIQIQMFQLYHKLQRKLRKEYVQSDLTLAYEESLAENIRSDAYYLPVKE